MGFGTIFLSEMMGTAMLILLGCGTVACNLLTKSKGAGSGFLFVNFGWGFAVMMGVVVGAKSGAHLNPAVTFGLLAAGTSLTFAQIVAYLLGQMVGAMIGAGLCWLAYKQQYDDPTVDPALKLGTFSTAPEIRNPLWNCVTEIIGTFVLVFVILMAGLLKEPVAMGWLNGLGVALLVVVIGIALGGPTGYAINPARDLGPRIMHAILPIRGKGGSDWSYAWIPVVAPIIGGVLAGLTFLAVKG